MAEKDRYGLEVYTRICSNCGMIMTNPRMIQDSYNDFYDTFYRKMYVGRKQASSRYWEKQRLRGEKIRKFLIDNGIYNEIESVLEIGCSAGGILNVFVEDGIKRCKGIDLGSEYLQYGREKGLDLEQASAYELSQKDGNYDLIILHHVFEHFLDIEKELQSISALLSERGYLYIAVPGVLNLNDTYERDFLMYIQNAHVRGFSLDTLNGVLATGGYKCIAGNEVIQAIYTKQENYVFEYKNMYEQTKSYLQELEKIMTISIWK